MTISAWAESAKIIVTSEALLGVILNVTLLILLSVSQIGKTANLYRTSCIITTVSSLYTSLLLLIAQDVFILIDGSVASVLYGPLLFYLPDTVNDLLAIAFFTQSHAMWQMIAAPTIVQWMFLASVRIFLGNNNAVHYYMRYVVPDESFRNELVKSISVLHGTDLTDYHVYGFRIVNAYGVGFLDVMLYDTTPSYCMTKHWTFTGFESRTRWIVLVLVFIAAVLLKIGTNEVVVIERLHCDELYRYTIGSVTRNDSTLLGIIGMASIAVPFVTLIVLNGGIVMMLRRQNVQQLRSLITQLTMGEDVMKMRRKNLRAATNTLLVIITAYLISNALNLALTMLEFVDRDFLNVNHPIAYRFAADTAGVLTAVGNAIRCPAHFVSNSEIRNQFYELFTGEPKEDKARSALDDFAPPTGTSRRNSHKHAHTPPLRRRMGSESLQSAWFSLLLNVNNEYEESEEENETERKESSPTSPLLLNAPRMPFLRHSAIAIC